MNQNPESRHTSAVAQRPRPVTLALGLLALVVASNIAAPLLPGSEGEIAFGIVAAVITSLAGVGLARLRRWGYIATIVVAALNILLNVPAFAVVEGALVTVAVAVFVVTSALIIVLVTRPEARRAYR